MKINDLKTRLLTSVFLIFLLYFSFNYSFILIISLILISLISWIEFQGLITKIFIKNNFKSSFLKIIIKGVSLLYLIIFSIMVFSGIFQDNFKFGILFLVSVCICSDIGGLLFGNFFKGKKLTKISPKKTISGSLGSFIFSLFLIPFFFKDLLSHEFLLLFLITIIISLFSQMGDLFISFLKRRAKVKDTSNLLPGHGGILDRIDGIIFAIPTGFFLLNYF